MSADGYALAVRAPVARVSVSQGRRTHMHGGQPAQLREVCLSHVRPAGAAGGGQGSVPEADQDAGRHPRQPRRA